ncbi:DMT family transporter [Geminicoccaceae bacterium 1502E]|nr:DMT family transporter [Geminicoccaceae bacterium 1502E]
MSTRMRAAALEAGRQRLGLLMGLAGVATFSLTLPATRLAVQELDVWFVAFGRMSLGAVAALIYLVAVRAPLPDRRSLPWLAATSLGVVLGFPLFSTLAMQSVDASHGGVVLAVLPLCTAAAAALLARERPSPAFWLVASAGGLLVLLFALLRGQGMPAAGDLHLVMACIGGALGYATGGALARHMPGLAVIAWALLMALPFLLLAAPLWVPPELPSASAVAWVCFLYVALGSQFVGFWFWYHGLAEGGIAKVSQLQLLQPFLTLAASGFLLHEELDEVTWAFAAATIGLVWLARRCRIGRA